MVRAQEPELVREDLEGAVVRGEQGERGERGKRLVGAGDEHSLGQDVEVVGVAVVGGLDGVVVGGGEGFEERTGLGRGEGVRGRRGGEQRARYQGGAGGKGGDATYQAHGVSRWIVVDERI